MRSDMSQVLIERPRSQSDWPSRKWAKRIPVSLDPDCEYEHEIIGKIKSSRRWQYGYDCKNSTDLLGPLKGYLRSKVGQPWDKVYSEVCVNLDKRKTTGAHVFTHLWQYVDTNCWIGVDDKVYSHGKYGRTQPDWFYVHPWTGLLCDSQNEGWRYRYKKKKEPITEYKINGQLVMWIKGIWYSIVREEKKEWSVWSNAYIYRTVETKYQLNKKELKYCGLSNMKLEFK